MKRRDWTDARDKVDEEGCCRYCGRSDRPLEAAHLDGQKYDEPADCKTCKGSGRRLAGAGPCGVCKGSGQTSTYYVDPVRTVPLCGPQVDTGTCHNLFDTGQLDLLPVLKLEEELAVVKSLRGIEPARIRLSRPAYESKVTR